MRANNNSYYRNIGIPLSQVEKNYEDWLLTRMYRYEGTYLKPQLTLGSRVRINKSKKVFDKGYMTNWSKEHLIIDQVPVQRRGAIRRVYKIKD